MPAHGRPTPSARADRATEELGIDHWISIQHARTEFPF
jgi:hypothetical protein